VCLGKSDGGGGHNWSSSVLDGQVLLADVFQDVSHPWHCICVRSSILWLFLSPSHRGVAVLFELLFDGSKWEWAKTLNSDDGNVVVSLGCSFSLKIVVNLARAEDDLSDFVVRNSRVVAV
jgi:hypothetical protein